MRITEKGQVTIPKAVRDAAGLMPGTDVAFVVEDGEVKIRKATDGSKRTRGQELVAQLRGMRRGGRSADEIIAEMRGPSADEEIEAARQAGKAS